MDAVREGLNSLAIESKKGDKPWTVGIKNLLCKIGRDKFGCKVCASGVDNTDYPEWLYDVTWLEYEGDDGPLVDAHLVAECEWGNKGAIRDDFEKLLLARAGVRLMIFNGFNKSRSKGVAEWLARKVRKFNGSCPEDTWLLAAWEGSIDDWSFRYFTIEMNSAAIRELI